MTTVAVRQPTLWQPCMALLRLGRDCEEQATLHVWAVCEHEHGDYGWVCTGHWRMQRDAVAAGRSAYTCEGCGHICRVQITIVDSRCLGCDCHHPLRCCDPNDCGPCCPDCPTCPSLH